MPYGSYVTIEQLNGLGALRTWVKAMATNGEIFEGWEDEVLKKISDRGLALSQYLSKEERDYVSTGQKVLDFLSPLAQQWASTGTVVAPGVTPNVTGGGAAPAPPADRAPKWANTAIIAGIGVVTILGIWMLTKKK